MTITTVDTIDANDAFNAWVAQQEASNPAPTELYNQIGSFWAEWVTVKVNSDRTMITAISEGGVFESEPLPDDSVPRLLAALRFLTSAEGLLLISARSWSQVLGVDVTRTLSSLQAAGRLQYKGHPRFGTFVALTAE